MGSSASEREHEELSVAARLEKDGAIRSIWGRLRRGASLALQILEYLACVIAVRSPRHDIG